MPRIWLQDFPNSGDVKLFQPRLSQQCLDKVDQLLINCKPRGLDPELEPICLLADSAQVKYIRWVRFQESTVHPSPGDEDNKILTWVSGEVKNEILAKQFERATIAELSRSSTVGEPSSATIVRSSDVIATHAAYVPLPLQMYRQLERCRWMIQPLRVMRDELFELLNRSKELGPDTSELEGKISDSISEVDELLRKRGAQ